MSLQLTMRVVTTAVLAVLAQSASAQVVEAPVLSGVEVPALSAVSVQPFELIDEGTTLTSTLLSVDDRMASMESRLSMIESRPTANSSCNCQPIASTRISTKLRGCPTNYAGIELAVLRAHVGSLNVNLFGFGGTVTETFDFDVAPRVYIGRERADGLGIRGTYFYFDEDTDPSPLGISTAMELHTFDIEATNRLSLCGMNMLFSGGVRYAHFEQDYRIGGGALSFDTEGAGLTIGTRIEKALGCGGLNLVLATRGSILMTDNEISLGGFLVGTSDNSTTKVLEARIALNKKRELRNGAQLVGEFGFEFQNWEAPLITGVLTNDVSLWGPTFRLALNF